MSIADYQLVEEGIEPKVEMDEIDVMNLLERTYGLLETVLAGRLKTLTRSDAIKLQKDIEEVIWFHRVH